MFNILIRQSSSADKTAEKQQNNQLQNSSTTNNNNNNSNNNKKRKAPRNHQMIPCVSLAETSILGNMKERAKEMKVFGCSFKFWNNFGRGLNENKGNKLQNFLFFSTYILLYTKKYSFLLVLNRFKQSCLGFCLVFVLTTNNGPLSVMKY